MNRWVYNVSVACGVALTAIGLGVEFGIGYGLAAAGVLIVGLSLYGARLARSEG